MQKVTDPALLAQLNGGGSAPVPQSGVPGVIMGRPKDPDPYKMEQDRISNANEAARLAIAQGADAR